MRAARRAAIMAGGKQGRVLSRLQEGDRLKIIEAGNAVPFYIAKHDYESSRNQTGRTLVVRQLLYDVRPWHNDDVNAYATSDIDAWFNGTYYDLLDADIKTQITAVVIPYTPGYGNWNVSDLSRKVFALSVTELGHAATYANIEGSALPTAGILQSAYTSVGTTRNQWTRSPNTIGNDSAYFLRGSGDVTHSYCYYRGCCSRPAFTLPFDLPVSLRPDADGCYTVV